MEDDRLSDEERERLLEAIDEGLADVAAGRVKSLSEIIERLRNQVDGELVVVEERGEEMAPDIKAAWQEEVQRRKERLEAGETTTRPWAEVKAELKKL